MNLAQLARQNQSLKRSGKGVEAPKSSNGNQAASKASRAANQEAELSDKERVRLRRQAEQRSLAKMEAGCRELLLQARRSLGSNSRQIVRIRGRMEDMDMDMAAAVPDEEDDCVHTVE